MSPDIERLAGKLKPLMPRQVEHWLQVRQTAEPAFRALIDQQILAEARRRFGEVDPALLTLPPQALARGTLELGTVLYEAPKWPMGLEPAELLQGLSIFGRSGSGKTNLLFHLLQQLERRGVVFLFMDWKRTGRHLIDRLGSVQLFTPGRSLSPLPFNPFLAPPGLEPEVYLQHVIDTLAQAYTLGDGSRAVLQKALAALLERGVNAPSVPQVLEAIERLPPSPRLRQWQASAVRALEALAFVQIGQQGGADQHQQMQTLLSRSSILELNGLGANAKAFLIPLICLWLYYVKLASPVREQLDLVLCLDEAHHVLYRHSGRSQETLMEALLRQLRELGVGVILCDQSCHLISAAALGNSFASVFLNQKDPRDVRTAAQLCGLEAQEQRYLTTLPVGEGIVRLQDRWRGSVRVRIPHVPIAKGHMSDQRLQQYWRQRHQRRTGTGASGPLAGAQGGSRRVPLGDQVLDEEDLRFLEDVLAHPHDGVRQRYRRLKVGGSKGQRMQRALLQRGWLETQLVPVGHTRQRLLRLSQAGREALGWRGSASPRESLAHAYWKHHYARQLQEQGWQVQVEAPRVGGRVDVLAHKDGRSLAVEVETGHSDVVANVKHGLRSGFERVLVVVTEAAARDRVARQLNRTGLLIAPRVQLVLQHHPRIGS